MRGINRVILVGHLGKDPDMQTLEGGLAVSKFSLATTESYKDKSGNRVEHTEWHNIVAWRGLAETASKYLHKGSLIFMEGRIRNRSYTDKDNIKRYFTDILCDNFTMLDRKEGSSPAHHQPPAETASAPLQTADESAADDLPF